MIGTAALRSRRSGSFWKLVARAKASMVLLSAEAATQAAAAALTGILLFLTACATTSRLHSAGVPSGSLRLAQVILVATRQEILSLSELQESHRTLLASGINDSELRDGSLALARVYCCGGHSEVGDAVMFYVPRDLDVGIGDIVELRSGRVPSSKDSGAVNVATRVRQRGPDGSCRWEPPDARLRLRFLYCDWMPAEGWVEHKQPFGKTWLRPAGGQP